MLDWFLLALFFSASACLSPGPNNVMLFLSGMNFGVKRSLPHYYGICFAYPLKILLVGLGITNLGIWLPYIVVIAHIAAIIFLIWYVLQVVHVTDPRYIKHDKPMTYHEAELFQWLNVKGWAVAITANTLIPTQAELQPAYYCVLLALTFMLVSLPIYQLILWLGVWVRHTQKMYALKLTINKLASFLLVGSALFLLYEEVSGQFIEFF
ncbi:lysine transporter LysE [Alishewanella longhuensis]|uniref:Lysine transporter LysE n=1 Tax=Alishewanella longhuensis TaxID=1091037 RepID=A0ABQ3KVI8_9ALTE|nr:lysine transporter LysE [Alishewanella longhuensis]